MITDILLTILAVVGAIIGLGLMTFLIMVYWMAASMAYELGRALGKMRDTDIIT